MAKDLTALAVEKALTGTYRKEIPDGNVRGLFLIVQPTGRKSWAFRYRRFDGRPTKLTLGGYPALDLASARRLASKARNSVAEGGDPAKQKQVDRAAARKPKDHELTENVVATFLERHAKANTREASWRETERILNKEVLSRWRGKPLAAVTRSDIHALLDAIVDRGSPIAANRSLAVIRRLCSWAVERDIISKSPCEGVRPPSQIRSRDRVLTDQELRLVWAACGEVGWPFGPITRLLILTGQRRDEVGGMSWDEIDLEEGTWLLPRGRAKNDNLHTVPLSDLAIAILRSVPRISSPLGLVFTTTGSSAVSGFSNAKERMDRMISAASESALPGWTFHDLRRTLASGLARLGTAPQVVDSILNHRSGTIRGVAAIYNRYDHAIEKRAALDLWASHVGRIVEDRNDRVASKSKAARAADRDP